MGKKQYMMIGIGVVVLLAGAAIFTAWYLQQQGTTAVAPNVPASKPKAQQAAPTSSPVQLSFNVGGTASPTATATATAAPAATATAAPAATATAAPSTTTTNTTNNVTNNFTTTTASTGTTTTSTKGSTATSSSLPKAGFEAPTILALSGGVLLLIAGVVLAL